MRFSSKNLSTFYYQLGTLVQAGLPIQNALRSMQKSAPRRMRSIVSILSTLVGEGMPPSEAMEQCGKSFEALDVHTISMTERSGALDDGFLSLSKYYETRASARSKLITGSLYPAFLLIATVFIIHFQALFLGAVGGRPYTLLDYLRDTVGLLVGLVVIAWLISFLIRRLFTVPGLNVVLDRMLRAIPVFGRLRFDYAISQWASSMRLMLAAGIGVMEALKSASSTIHSPLIAHAYKQAEPQIRGGAEISEALESTGVFPDLLIQYWTTGAKSGRLDDMLDRVAKFYEDRWRRSLDQFVTWLPRLAYGLIAAFIIFQIFKSFNTYLNVYNTFLGQ